MLSHMRLIHIVFILRVFYSKVPLQIRNCSQFHPIHPFSMPLVLFRIVGSVAYPKNYMSTRQGTTQDRMPTNCRL